MVLESLPDGTRTAAAVVAMLGAVVGSALLAATEAALLSFPRTRRHEGGAASTPARARVEAILQEPQRVLLTVSVGTTLLDVTAAVIAAFLVRERLGDAFGALLVVVAAGTFLLLTFARVLPRAIGAHRAETWSLLAAPPYRVVAWTLSPVVVLYSALARGVLRVAGEGEAQAGAYASEEELKTLITIGAEEGIIEGDEEEMIHSVLEFGETLAKEIMVPRADIVAVPADATLGHVRAFVAEAGFSRMPVYQGTVDNVVGVLLVKEMLLRVAEGKGALHVREIMKEPLFVPETKKLDDLLTEMRQKRVHLALVVDEFGGVSGLITMEDLIEEIVGEIFDEDDLGQEQIRRLDDGSALVDARTHVEEVNEALGTTIPEDGPYDTVGGFVLHRLGRVGKESESVTEGAHDFFVDKVVNRRIVRVRVAARTPRSAAHGRQSGPRERPATEA